MKKMVTIVAALPCSWRDLSVEVLFTLCLLSSDHLVIGSCCRPCFMARSRCFFTAAGVTDYHWTYEVAMAADPDECLVLTQRPTSTPSENVILNSFGSHILIFGASKQVRPSAVLKGQQFQTLVSASALSDDAKQDMRAPGPSIPRTSDATAKA